MSDRKHDDPNAMVRSIIEGAIAQLIDVGMESREAAAGMLATQAFLRIWDTPEGESFTEFVNSFEVDDDDDHAIN